MVLVNRIRPEYPWLSYVSWNGITLPNRWRMESPASARRYVYASAMVKSVSPFFFMFISIRSALRMIRFSFPAISMNRVR